MSEHDDETLRVSGEVTPVSSPSNPSKAIDHGRFVPGALVGSRYRIVALLGKGGMGEVYRADDLLLGQPVALKFLPKRVGGNAQALARLLGEVRIARQISHPNVCRVYDVGEVDGEHFISMEYVQGEDLRSLLHRIGRFGPDKGVQIAREICAGLAAAHDKGVLHRDLKPANVMIDERGVARITDFGLAVLADSADAQRREGTPAYMSPEQLEGETITTRSDIYSLGLVLYEIFSGRMLFEAKTLTELLEIRRSATATAIRLTNDIDPLVERVIQRCLTIDPAKRPKSATAVAAALPGGDPLAAALAAGETPSPDVVAAAGEHGGVKPVHALAALATGLVLLVLVLICKSKVDILSVAGIHDPPDAMALRGRDLLARLGYAQRPADRAWSYAVDQQQRAAVFFWYRESPEVIVPSAFFRRDVYATRPGSVSENEPQLATPGESTLRLDADGRLLAFKVVPANSTELSVAPFDWNPLLDAARVDRAAVRPVAPLSTRVPFDHRAAWLRRDGWRLEAASLAGRAVSFEMIPPLPRGAPHASPHGSLMGLIWMLLLLTIVGLLAGRNIRMRRADLRGTTRTGFLSAISIFAAWLFGADHVPTTSEIGLFIEALAWSSLLFIVIWAGYAALEPTMRRRWPYSMVSWARLLTGDWRDSLVGRDVLAGTIGGCTIALSDFGVTLASAALRSMPVVPVPESDIVILNGSRQAIADLVSLIPRSLTDSMALVILLIVLRALLRRDWLAAGVLWLTQLAFLFSAVRPLEGVVSTGIVIATIAFLPRRFGFLALLVAFVVSAILAISPVLWPPAAWHTGFTLLAAGFVAALGIYGFIVSLGGRPIFSGEFLEA
jgi:serine/threonine-protein kinase